jgi:phage portal protein BeeE
MNIFTRIGSWMQDGLRRMTGIQYGIPSGYSEESASPVTFETAMQLSAVWACVKLIAETISSLPDRKSVV